MEVLDWVEGVRFFLEVPALPADNARIAVLAGESPAWLIWTLISARFLSARRDLGR